MSQGDTLLSQASVPRFSLCRRFILYAMRPPRLRTLDARDSRGATQTELFFDLVLALPWGALVDSSSLSYPKQADTQHIIAVTALFNGWIGWAFFNTRYDTDSATARFSAILVMTGFTAMGFGVRCIAQSASVLICDDDEAHNVNVLFILGYVTVRGVLWLNYVVVWCSLPSQHTADSISVRGFLTGFGASLVLCGLAAALNAPEQEDARLVCFLMSLMVDVATPFVLIPYQPAIRIHHMLGRFGRFLLVCVNSTVLMPLLQSARLENDTSVSILSPLIALWPPFCLVQLHSAPIGGLAASRERVEHFHRSYEGTTLRKLRIYAFFYSHLPLTMLVSALFTKLEPWDALSGPAGDKVLWAGVLLCLAAQHVLVSVRANAKRALSRAAVAVVMLGLAFADPCFAPSERPTMAPPMPPNAPPRPPTGIIDWPLSWSLCSPAFSSFVLCLVLVLDVLADAYLSFVDMELANVSQGLQEAASFASLEQVMQAQMHSQGSRQSLQSDGAERIE